jgi:hypothetical protein
VGEEVVVVPEELFNKSGEAGLEEEYLITTEALLLAMMIELEGLLVMMIDLEEARSDAIDQLGNSATTPPMAGQPLVALWIPYGNMISSKKRRMRQKKYLKTTAHPAVALKLEPDCRSLIWLTAFCLKISRICSKPLAM